LKLGRGGLGSLHLVVSEGDDGPSLAVGARVGMAMRVGGESDACA